MKKILSTLMSGLLAFGLVACSNNEADQKLKEKEKEITKGLNKEMTLDILENEHVNDAYVQNVNGTAKAVLELKKDTTEKQKEELVKQYNKELQKKYPDQNVNVIVTVAE